MHRIAFLDIDGVLNSVDFARGQCFGPRRGPRQIIDQIDPVAVAYLERINAETRCDWVLSSTWRKSTPLFEMQHMLRHYGFRGSLIGATPGSPGWCEVAGIERSKHERGLEIEWWLRNSGLDLGDLAIVILDDDSDMSQLKDRLVHTSHDRGLTARETEQAIAMLQIPLGPRLLKPNPWLSDKAWHYDPQWPVEGPMAEFLDWERR